jgi:hypothetical protein
MRRLGPANRTSGFRYSRVPTAVVMGARGVEPERAVGAASAIRVATTRWRVEAHA